MAQRQQMTTTTTTTTVRTGGQQVTEKPPSLAGEGSIYDYHSCKYGYRVDLEFISDQLGRNHCRNQREWQAKMRGEPQGTCYEMDLPCSGRHCMKLPADRHGYNPCEYRNVCRSRSVPLCYPPTEMNLGRRAPPSYDKIAPPPEHARFQRALANNMTARNLYDAFQMPKSAEYVKWENAREQEWKDAYFERKNRYLYWAQNERGIPWVELPVRAKEMPDFLKAN